uniref:Alcohol dehydrogenase-like C-terminal domain-containing protein n=1 Tax=Euplotes harpa TaxID=151035 RepID=A0A7S3J4H5_9SPIT
MRFGVYGLPTLFPPTPIGVGFEGAGTIVEAHESLGDSLIGKKVAFAQDPHSKSFQGTWRQYLILHKLQVIPIPDDADLDKFSSSFVNPVTVIGFIDVATKAGHKAIVHDAACSSLGKMLVKYCKKLDYPLINVVRREEQVKTLKDLGAEHVLNSSLETFENDLKELTHKLEATGFFDAIAGDTTGLILNNMPRKSTAYVYGALSGKAVSYSPGGFIFLENTISSFWLGPYLRSITEEERAKHIGTIIHDLSTGGAIFGSDVVQTFPLAEFEAAITAANEKASEGKTILKPHD